MMDHASTLLHDHLAAAQQYCKLVGILPHMQEVQFCHAAIIFITIRLHWLDRRIYPFAALPPELLQRIQAIGDHCDVTVNKYQHEQEMALH